MSDASYTCPRCGNSDPRYIGMKNGKPYCRRCVSFIGEKAPVREREPTPSPLRLHYELSGEQKEISMRIQRNFLNGIDTLVYAVCGAGKTELSYGVIALALRKGLQVGFALPRRDVVIELYWRIREAFPEDRVVAVYGEHTHALTGDIIILTTHQLYRYPHYFDLLVMDEIDAFPFKGSEALHAMCKASIRGRVVMMSATPSKEILKEFSAPGHDIVELRTRFHKKPIPMPKTKIMPRFLFAPYCVCLLKRYAKERKPCFVFVPTKALSESVFRAVSPFVKGGDYVNSSRKGRERIISDFKKGKLMYLVTTSVLERGVTIRGLQVIVYEADEESIYDSSTLIQIAGRAGRKADAPNGDVIFLAEKEIKSINDARREIGFCNTFL